MPMPSHSRQTSGSFEKPAVEPIGSVPAQPIARPAPIQRPSSVKSQDENRRPGAVEVDELANTLGSKALLDDADDIPEPPPDRRTSLQGHGSMRGFPFQDPISIHHRADPYAPFQSSGGGSVWGSTPPMPFPMMGSTGWGSSPTSGPFNNQFMVTGMRRSGEPQVVWVRRMICSICKEILAARQAGPDGFIDVGAILDRMHAIVQGEVSFTPQEVREACEIFGDLHNGGGTLDIRDTAQNGQIYGVKFTENVGPTPTLGEIGSPVPQPSVPVGGGFGGPQSFPGLGPQF